MEAYEHIRQHVMKMLEEGLPDELTYHSPDHTQDVANVCEAYIEREQISPEEAELLRLGAIFHDSGFTISTNDHEEHGVEIAHKIMSDHGYTQEQIEIVSNLIRATKIPQQPNTYLEKIICDADLDYLGRDDFYEISDLLFRELNALGQELDKEAWDDIQIRFLQNHHYHTDYARKNLQPMKQKRLEELMSRE